MKKFKKDLRNYSDKVKAKILQGFFKTGEGQYGKGDVFLGVSVLNIRNVVKGAVDRFSLDNIQELLRSGIHEERLSGVLILVEKYRKADEKNKKVIYNFYLANGKNVNNWDLVDLSAPKIVGNYLVKKNNREILYEFAKSENLWEKRISIISTFSFIRNEQYNDTLKISKILLKDKHDLINKAVGWMLREVGKRDKKILEKFLKDNYSELPRTTLRYAIEKFEENERKKWLKGEIQYI